MNSVYSIQSKAIIDKPNEYSLLDPESRPIILKIHGAIDKSNDENDSFVITEDDYIAYLTRTDLSIHIPTSLIALLQRSNFLFLGYSLRDWNLRAILYRLWEKQNTRNYSSWAVQLNPDDLETKFWKKRDVEIIDMDLANYIDKFDKAIDSPEIKSA